MLAPRLGDPEGGSRGAGANRRGSACICALRTVVRGDRMHLVLCQLCRKRTHLLVDVVLPYALGEGRELAFYVRSVLTFQRWSSELLSARAMTGGAGRDPAAGIAGKDQTNRRIALAASHSARLSSGSSRRSA